MGWVSALGQRAACSSVATEVDVTIPQAWTLPGVPDCGGKSSKMLRISHPVHSGERAGLGSEPWFPSGPLPPTCKEIRPSQPSFLDLSFLAC